MHELSIAVHLVALASEQAADAGSDKVNKVYVKLGVLSGVVREALEFSFEVAAADTMLEGAALEIEDVPAVVFCPQCRDEKQLSDALPVFRACCPACGTPTPEIRQGQELEITAIRVLG